MEDGIGQHNGMNSIKLTFTKTCESLFGQSKWWGAPDLPAGSPYPVVPCSEEGDEWDEPLTFLCQIRCEDIAALDPEGLLPHSGMLYFFAAVDYFLGIDGCPLDTPMGEWPRENVRIMYSPTCDGLEPYEMHWDDGTSVFQPAEKLGFEACGERGDSFKLLGRPYFDEICELYDEEYVSVLQIDEEDDWRLRFFDCGMLCLLLRKSQLLARDWESAVGYLHSF